MDEPTGDKSITVDTYQVGDVIGTEHLGVNHSALIRHEGQVLERQESPIRKVVLGFRLYNPDQILNPGFGLRMLNDVS